MVCGVAPWHTVWVWVWVWVRRGSGGTEETSPVSNALEPPLRLLCLPLPCPSPVCAELDIYYSTVFLKKVLCKYTFIH